MVGISAPRFQGVDQFREAMAAAGIVCADDIIADGRIHRFMLKTISLGRETAGTCFMMIR